ncbi:hypothetical protein GMRT_13796 [Giardia muris]|uniref:Uncharacterized protein n=1 Tax=Giardia muris TaxID=5742 RepID=A0A4Z1T428_GIAMU|nr:hypothetical protein GMRT_13796 [Giardia muris]|eukprot:TNJ28733.1 hypothetical protein GMRT_13796 [Giardia muris]
MLSNFTADYLAVHRLLPTIEAALNACVAGNLDSPEAYISMLLMQTHPGSCHLKSCILVPPSELIIVVAYCSIQYSFSFQLEADVAIGLSELLSGKEISSRPASTPSVGNQREHGTDKRKEPVIQEPKGVDLKEPVIVNDPEIFSLIGKDIFQRISSLWPLILRATKKNSSIAGHLYEYFIFIGVNLLHSSPLAEMRRRATYVSRLTFHYPIPYLELLHWEGFLQISLAPTRTNALPFQKLVNKIFDFLLACGMTGTVPGGEGRAPPSAKGGKKPQPTGGSKKGEQPGVTAENLLPIRVVQEAGKRASFALPVFDEAFQLVDEDFTLCSFNQLRIALCTREDEGEGSKSVGFTDLLARHTTLVALCCAVQRLLSSMDPGWTSYAFISISVDCLALSEGLRTKVYSASDALMGLQERVQGASEEEVTKSPELLAIRSYLESFKKTPLMSDIETALFTIFNYQKSGIMELVLRNLKGLPEDPTDVVYNPLVAPPPPETGKKPTGKKPETPAVPETPAFIPPVIYSTYTRGAYTREVLLAVSQCVALSEAAREMDANVTSCPSASSLSVRVIFDQLETSLAFSEKLKTTFSDVAQYVTGQYVSFVEQPCVCGIPLPEYLEMVSNNCAKGEDAPPIDRMAFESHALLSASATTRMGAIHGNVQGSQYNSEAVSVDMSASATSDAEEASREHIEFPSNENRQTIIERTPSDRTGGYLDVTLCAFIYAYRGFRTTSPKTIDQFVRHYLLLSTEGRVDPQDE